MYSNGVTLKDIANHVYKSIGVSVSRHTIHRLMQPPRRKTTASKLYKGIVNARVPPKRNTKEKHNHPDFHYTCSQVNLVNQMAHLCEQNTLMMSVDNKNKVEVGIPATSRRTNIRTFHMVDQAPIYNDHDFPNPNAKLVPAGYQILRHSLKRRRSVSPPRILKVKRKRSLSEGDLDEPQNLCKDKLGRNRIKWLQLYPSRVIESTNVMHVNHLMKQIHDEKRLHEIFNVIAVADGGPDWSVKGVINFLSMGLLWKNLNLDTFVVQCYAPGHSRFNPIERTWSFLTNKIATVVLPDDINGVTPAFNDEKAWFEVLDNAVDLCSRFWDKKEYCGFPIKVETFKSDNPIIPKIKKTHAIFKDFANASQKKLRETPGYSKLQDIYQFLVKHANRKAYQIEFIRCQDQQCNHCSRLPARENQFLQLVREFGGSCPVPRESEIFIGHYKTFLDMLRTRGCTKTEFFNPTNFGSCEHHGCSYLFFSKADKLRHMKLMKH